jgi:hypothetical protein
MDERPEPATFALDIMRDWKWLSSNPDGVTLHPGMDLGSVENRLAMAGLRKPKDAILTLLCRGDLASEGSYRWEKYQDCEQFHMEVVSDAIEQGHWQRLAKLIEEDRNRPGITIGKKLTLQLVELGLNDCLSHDWECSACRFSYAIVTDQLDPWHADYTEEWYSAWEISVWPASLWPSPSADTPESKASGSITNKGGRPTSADWEGAALEMAGRYYRGDLKPSTIAEVRRALAAWLGEQDCYPADSTILPHAKRIFDAFQAWERE